MADNFTAEQRRALKRAREAYYGGELLHDGSPYDVAIFLAGYRAAQAEVEQRIAAAQAIEREECAKVCEECDRIDGLEVNKFDCAAAIRARKGEQT